MRPTLLFPALRAFTTGVLVTQLAFPVAGFSQQAMQQASTPQAKPEMSMDGSMAEPSNTDRKGRMEIVTPPAEPLTDYDQQVAAAKAAKHAPLDNDARILLVLDRFTYGARPGDLERLRRMGLQAWFHEQLNPQLINDAALDERLLQYPAMKLPLDRMFDQFSPEDQVRAAAQDRRTNGSYGDAGAQAVFKVRVEEYRAKEEERKVAAKESEAAAAHPMTADQMGDPDMKGKGKGDKKVEAEALPLPMDQILAMVPDVRYKFLLKLNAGQLRELARDMPKEDRGTGALMAGFTPAQMEIMRSFRGPREVIASEAVQTKLLRDIYSEKQLQEVMVDFWLNHFNVYMKKDQQAPYFIAAYEREVIRPFALGHFENLLLATAQSPAMLDYLDQKESIGPHSVQAMEGGGGKKKAGGLNENYAREVMELHTVGVDGGYTQKDVTELAKVFTGWTVVNGYRKGEPTRAIFNAQQHEPGNKVVLGRTFHDTGLSEGLEALKMLASSPQCAHFISKKIAVRFMGDEPPASVVNRMTAAFTETHGDIRQVLAAMVNAPEFFTAATYRTKVKTPQDFVVSAVRASGSDVQDPSALAKTIAQLGMPMYGHQAPDGYSMRSDAWNTTTALVSRMNFAMALASNRVQGVQTDFAALIGKDTTGMPAKQKQDLIEARLLHAPVSARTEQLILAETTAPEEQQQAQLRQVAGVSSAGLRYGKGGDKNPNNRGGSYMAGMSPSALDMQAALAVGLVIGSPEFQKR